MLIGTFTTVAFIDPYADYAFGLVDASPTWYVVIILILGILATGASAVTTTYSSGLGLQTIAPRLTRFSTTMITAVASGVLIYLGAIYSGLADVILAATLITLVITTPWAVVILLGHWLNKGRYNYYDLTRIVRGETGGIYWSTGGWNLRGTAALVIGSFFGIMAVQAPPIITGPWANIASGVDVSFLGAALVSAVVYLVLRWIFPEAEIVEDGVEEPALTVAMGK
jgi:purine-cytosine permease-like protein